MDVALYQMANAVTMFVYEMPIAAHPLVGCVARDSTPNCQHHALFQVQLCMLAFRGKLFFSLQSISREQDPSAVIQDLISVCTSSPALLFELRKLLHFFAFPFLPSMAVLFQF